MLETLKMMLGFAAEDKDIEPKLRYILSAANARLTLLLGNVSPPDELNHIIIDVAIARFNKIGSEGLASHTVEGETMSFTEDDFAPFAEEIQAFLENQNTTSRGKVRFI